jgi:hypothetical protein
MPQGLWNLEWLNQNSQRNYPLAEIATGTDVTASFTLPQEFILELDLPIDSGMNVDPSRFFVQTVTAYATGFSIIVGYQPTSGSAVSVATALIPRSAHVNGQMYALGGIGNFADTVGKVVIGRFDDIDEQAAGSFTFSLTSAPLDPDCVRPILRGVSSISIASGAEISQPLYGDIILVADQNIQLTTVVVSGQDPQILISAIQGEGLIDTCVCEGDQNGSPILTINGIPPTAGGDFTILGNDCLNVQGIQNGIQLVDTCSQPCCGCQELEAVTRDLERFGSEAATLQSFITTLQAQVTNMDQVVLGSKLNDTGCVQCG